MRIDELIQLAGDLPPLPQVAQKALAMIRNQSSSMADVANVLAMDQAMASLVLRWANSAYYGLPSTVATVQQAVTFLGQNAIQSLILTASVSGYMNRPVPGYGLARGELWKHAIGVAAGARLVAIRRDRKLGEEAYHAGLLCDIGKLALEVVLRNRESTLIESQGKPFVEIETALAGIDHAALGAAMAQRWQLPSPLITAITYHHRPSQAPDNQLLTASVHIADAAMMMFGIGIGNDGLQYELDPNTLSLVGFQEADLENLFTQVTEMIKAAENFVGFPQD